ncbi:peptidase S24/S26A/S26B/S26C [Hyaloraphidium curvatum]|nr:peptidase S24/S26A/S26B/S26C [Hyaloraphidium curvatum]
MPGRILIFQGPERPLSMLLCRTFARPSVSQRLDTRALLSRTHALGGHEAPPPKPGSRVVWFLRRVAWFVLPSMVVWQNVVAIGRVEGRSMQPTLNPDSNQLIDDIVLLDKWSIKRGYKFNVGDIVFCTAPHDKSLTLTKRIVALPFDLVRPLDFTKKASPSGQFLSDKVIEIPQGRCWLESDEPFHGTDSNTFGPVPLGLIQARVAYVIFPRFRKLDRGDWEERSKVPMWEETDSPTRRISYRSGGTWVQPSGD